MNATWAITAAGVAALIAGCASTSGNSYVGVTPSQPDAEVLASSVTEFTAHLLLGSGTVALLPTTSSGTANILTPLLVADLQRRGFVVLQGGASTVAGPEPVDGGAHRLGYTVTALDAGDLVRVTLDGTHQGARFFQRDAAGALQAGGPFTVTQAEAAASLLSQPAGILP